VVFKTTAIDHSAIPPRLRSRTTTRGRASARQAALGRQAASETSNQYHISPAAPVLCHDPDVFGSITVTQIVLVAMLVAVIVIAVRLFRATRR
jgi:hypothetical protein